MKTRRKPLRIHVEDCANKPDVFRLTEQRVKAARRRNADAFEGFRITHGCDFSDPEALLSADALVTSTDVILSPRFPKGDMRKGAPNLRWIHIIGAGVEKLMPLDWLPEDATLTNNSGVHADKIGESVAMFLLMLNARMPEILTSQRDGRWNPIFTGLIRGKTALIVGLGDLGIAAARSAKALGLNVIGVRRRRLPARHVDRVVPVERLDAVLPKADFVIVATPLTPATRNLLSRRRIGLMRKGAGLLNIGRGPVVDTEAMVQALESGALSGAVSDVFEPEPLPADSKLWRTPNLVIMPHCSSDDLDLYIPGTLDLVARIAPRFRAGRPLPNAVDRVAMY